MIEEMEPTNKETKMSNYAELRQFSRQIETLDPAIRQQLRDRLTGLEMMARHSSPYLRNGMETMRLALSELGAGVEAPLMNPTV